MEVITYTKAKARFLTCLNQVCESQKPMEITRKGVPSVVLMPISHFEALQETAYLLHTPVNAKRLLDAVVELNAVKSAS